MGLSGESRGNRQQDGTATPFSTSAPHQKKGSQWRFSLFFKTILSRISGY